MLLPCLSLSEGNDTVHRAALLINANFGSVGMHLTALAAEHGKEGSRTESILFCSAHAENLKSTLMHVGITPTAEQTGN